MDVLEEDLKNKFDPRLRQAAAVHILRAVGLYGTNMTPKGATTPEGVEAGWGSVEAMDEAMKMMAARLAV